MVEYKLRAMRGMLLIFLMMVLSAVIGYFLRMTIARNLSVADYGLFYSVLSFVLLFTLLKDLGLNQALVKYIPEFLTRNQKKDIKSAIMTVFLIEFGVAFIIALILICSSHFLAIHFFHADAAVWILIFIALFYWLSSFQDIFYVIAQGFQASKYYSVVEVLRNSFLLLFVLIAFVFYKSAIVPAFIYFIVMLILPFIYFIFLLRIFPGFLRIKTEIRWPLVKKFFNFSFPVLIGSIGSTFISYADVLSLTWFRSLDEVGFYSVALPTVMLIWYVPLAVSAVLFPMVSEMNARGHKEYLRKGISLVYKYSYLIVTPVAFTMLLFPDIIIRILFGEKYIGGAIALQILAIGSIFYTIALINSNVLAGLGKVKTNAAIILITAVLNIVLCIVLVPKYGVGAAAAATSSSYFLMMILNTFVLQKKIQLPLPLGTWLKILISGIAFISVILLLKNIINLNVWIEAIICLTAATIAYILFISAIFRIVTIARLKEEIFSFLKLR